MNVLDKGLGLLLRVVKVLVAELAQVEMLAFLQRIIERNPVCKLYLAALAFPSSHSTLEDNKRIFVFACRISWLIFSKDSEVFKDDEMITTFEMSVDIGSTKDDSKVFEFDSAHIK